MKEIKHLRILYENTERDLVNMQVQAWIYQREVDHPVHIGKEEAQKSLDTYQKRIQFLQENLEMYRQYARVVLNTEL